MPISGLPHVAPQKYAEGNSIGAAMMDGYIDTSDLYENDLFNRERTPSPPPPPSHLPFTGRGRIAIIDEPFDWDDNASVSSRGSDNWRRNLASAALRTGEVLSTDKHPIVDCAFNIYLSQLRRTPTHNISEVTHSDAASLAQWHEACATVSGDFFWLRQNPPLCVTPEDSAALVGTLLSMGVLVRPRHIKGAKMGVLPQYVTEAALLQSQQRHNVSHPALQPPRLHMTTVALNMTRDAGRFEFFELKDIYGFAAPQHAKIDSPLRDVPTTTRDACKMHNGGGQVTADMVVRREKMVAERKREVRTLISEHTAAARRAGGNNFL